MLISSLKTDLLHNLKIGRIETKIENETSQESTVDQNQDIKQLQKSYQNEIENL